MPPENQALASQERLELLTDLEKRPDFRSLGQVTENSLGELPG
jgi:hypothetical protein